MANSSDINEFVKSATSWITLCGMLLAAAVAIGVFYKQPAIVEQNQIKNDRQFEAIANRQEAQTKEIVTSLDVLRSGLSAQAIKFDYMQKDLGRLEGKADAAQNEVSRLAAKQVEFELNMRSMLTREQFEDWRVRNFPRIPNIPRDKR